MWPDACDEMLGALEHKTVERHHLIRELPALRRLRAWTWCSAEGRLQGAIKGTPVAAMAREPMTTFFRRLQPSVPATGLNMGMQTAPSIRSFSDW